MQRFIIFCALLFICCELAAQSTFKVIPLGVRGGSDESNLSCYALAAQGTDDYVLLDAGTVHFGIKKAIEHKSIRGTESEILKKNVKGYLISHPHLDHISGLILNSPDDSPKPIYGLPFCIDVLKNNYFTWKSWANFANEGEQPFLNKYHYVQLPLDSFSTIEGTKLEVKPFYLSHANANASTAFLLRYNGRYILYLGDTGADAIEKSESLKNLWKVVGSLIKEKKLQAIFIEVSFDNAQPDNLLFGHLTPRFLMKELDVLSQVTKGGELKGFPIVITHMKPSGDRENKIKQELIDANINKVKLIFPQQGKLLQF